MQYPTLTADELRASGLFGGFSQDRLERLAATLKVLRHSAGAVIVREGDEAREMFVVVEGEVEIIKRGKGGAEARVALLGAGAWFGEMSILDIQRRSATVRTLRPSRLVRISLADLDLLYREDIKSYALLVLNLARELSRRLRAADGLLADFVSTVVDRPLAASATDGAYPAAPATEGPVTKRRAGRQARVMG